MGLSRCLSTFSRVLLTTTYHPWVLIVMGKGQLCSSCVKLYNRYVRAYAHAYSHA